jgi:hypothetical protein
MLVSIESMTIIYTDPGQMYKRIDIWDQPSQPNSDGSKQDPVLYAEGIAAQITGIWQTTTARRLQQQVLSEVTHQIIIHYLAGLKTRMFILYNDPDSFDDAGNNVPRRFDIDRFFDPDENKVEQWILAIERNDGR